MDFLKLQNTASVSFNSVIFLDKWFVEKNDLVETNYAYCGHQVESFEYTC
jgi:hypothetical protein